MATFNGKAFIREQLDSLLSQSFSDFCLYVHDDGSNDGTKDILEEYQNGHSDKIVILDTPPCGGAKSNFMHLLCEVDADYYFFCDQDDVWDNKKIEKMFHVMVDKEDKDIPFALFSDLFVVNSDMTKLADSYFDYCGYNPKRTYYRQILIQNFIPGCALCFNKATAMMARSFSDLRNIYMHDWWVALIASLKGKISFINEPLVYYRQHNENSIGAEKKLSLFVVAKHVMETIWGDRKRQIMERINRPRSFAKELCKLRGLNENDRIFLMQFSEIANRKKIARIRFYQIHKLYRNNHRNWLMLIFV